MKVIDFPIRDISTISNSNLNSRIIEVDFAPPVEKRQTIVANLANISINYQDFYEGYD